MILQIASGHFGWNRIVKAMPYMTEDPAGVLIKIGQGAKPGDGGLLMAAKVAEHIQAIRGVPKADLLSPPNHQGLYSIEESVQKMFLSFNAAFKFRVPVAIKVAASSTSVSVFNNLVRDPYNIVGGFLLDGHDGGTVLPDISSTTPVIRWSASCAIATCCGAQGRQGQIPLGRGLGKTDLAADASVFCLGANGVFTGKLILQLAGCLGNGTVVATPATPVSARRASPPRNRFWSVVSIRTGLPKHRQLLPGHGSGTSQAHGTHWQLFSADRPFRLPGRNRQGCSGPSAGPVRLLRRNT
jgi:glutamate synthase (NADPH/NADH) large chain